jgi:tetratricopeptide (TPR) repeat protein/tRNA A-37 threonylcarbamoyl transferase component Bud32
VLSVLGAGGMGVVYKARNPKTGQVVALKTVRVPNETLLAGFRREIHALMHIRHPGIVRVFEQGMHEGLPWYAMAFLEGRTLYSTIHGQPVFETRRLLDVVSRLCDALAFLHGEGIVHCDLKPTNVLVLPTDQPVLFDFGLATTFAGKVSREALDIGQEGAGTAAYMAPEQIQGDTVDARTDLYALGCILYEIVVGAPPFGLKKPIEVAWAHLGEPPIPPSSLVDDVPAGLEALVMRLLAKRPAERLGYAADVAAALGAGARPAVETPPPRSYLYRPAFAGRERDLEALRPLLGRARKGRGAMALIEGPSGVGKTRFVVELGRLARASGFRVVTGECAPPSAEAGGAPLAALSSVVEALADRCRGGGAEETERVFGPRLRLLAAFMPSVLDLPADAAAPEPAELPADAARLRLYGYLGDLLDTLVADRPVLLVLDDLQWADEVTLGFLEHLLATDAIEPLRLLVVTTCRSDEMPARIAALRDRDGVTPLALGRLDDEAVASIVGDMLALSPPPVVLGRFVTRHSEGNPFFAAEYLRAAVEAGALRRDADGNWGISELGPKDSRQEFMPVPGSLREVVERRLANLPVEALAAARAGAVLGREADVAEIARVARLGDAELMEAINELVRRQVLDEPAPGRLRFAHDKIREAAYASIAPRERALLHRRAAKALGRSGAVDRSQLMASLGGHWEHGGKYPAARRSYLAGARAARTRFAHVEAERLYRAALALGAGTPEMIAARRELAAEVLLPRGRAGEAIAELRIALDEAVAVGDRLAEAEAMQGLGIAAWQQGRLEEARTGLERALEIGGALGDRHFEGATLGALGNVHLQRGHLDEARDLYEGALAVARETGDRRAEGVQLGNVAIVDYDQGRLEEAEARYREAIEITRDAGDRRAEGRLLGNLALLLADRELFVEARDLYEGALAITRETGDRREEGIVLGNLADMLTYLGALDEALEVNERARALHRRTGNRRFEGVTLLARAEVENYFGHLDAADASVSRAEAILDEVGDPLYVALCTVLRGHLALARGASASEHLERATAAAAALHAGPESNLGKQICRLEHAVADAAAGRPLRLGHRDEDLPAGVLAWMLGGA